MSDLGSWLQTVPYFTRYWFCSTIAVSLIARFQLVNPMYLVLTNEAFSSFQIWRFVTCILYFPITPMTGFRFLLNLYFLYNYSRRLEESTFAGRPSDYCFMLVFNAICCIIFAFFMNILYLMDLMVLSVLYIWCQLNRETIVTFWFGTRFKAVYLPWVLLAFNVVLNGGGVMELIGILVGHVYFFLKFKYPQELEGPTLLETPAFLKQIFPDQVGGVHSFGSPPQRPAQGQGGGNNNRFPGWGRGYVLGGN
ncbi:unnamed protein product [Brassicogethes aeneus]|uniref:Derlin n=1 Tax=Brassicogethes aeneus TaxID=1431903 RepID=A0A9P0AY64_BRAAE|nr:unnamed protein product [Brassicogethes aeneus]